EQAVIEMWCQGSDHLCAQTVDGIVGGSSRGNIVSFVYDEDVESPRVCRMWREGILHHPHRDVALEPVDGRDEPREVRPRVDVNPTRPSQLSEQRRVDDAKLEAELLLHLVLPLHLQRRGADHEHRSSPMSKQQLLD